ncbi:kinetochore scaffold 1 [Trichosurus vulpecula]|uniref:kinetochore scaffold 1 n=1 Tax=Trichosurus vulpecula TaxID=9337 RepID=UPI00186B140C|nr:kinetochore scaffold 1 [Trichosurus vulpecula]
MGMETLLHAPIQVQLQQPEGSDMEPVHEKKYGNDQTVIFSDENQMDLTASNTVMITKGFLSCPEMGKPSKIDTKSFLANLKSHTEDLTMNKEFNLSTDPERIADKCSFQSKTSTSSENKVNFNDFIKRLKLEKSISSCTEGPDKENVFIAHIPSQGPNNDAFSLPKKHIFPNAEENGHGVTSVFRDQDDRKDITQCHTDNIQSMDPIARETLLRPAEGCDFTVYGNDFMDLTVNHTAQILLPTNNASGIENHIQSVTVDVTKGDCTTKNPGSKRTCRNQQNVPCQDSSGNLEDKIDITRSHNGMTNIPPTSQASNQSSVTLALAPESTCPGPVFQGDKTVFFSSNDDAMEMTKSLTPKRDDKNACVSNLTQMCPNPGNAISSLMDKTVYSEEVDMDITKSNTVAIHDQIIELCPTNVQGPSPPNLENELLFQDQKAVSEDIKQNKSCSSVSYVTTGKLQQGLANPLSVSLSGNKSVVFSGEDMDLTKCCTVKIDSKDDMKRHSTDINTFTLESTLGQNSRLSESLKKHVADTSLAFCHDKTLMFTEQQQNMDLTRSHTAVTGCEDMDLTKCCTVKIDSSDLGTQLPLTSANMLAPVKTKKPLSPSKRPRLENAQLLDKRGGSKSMNELYSNKTVAFPAGDKNNMEITSVLTKEINHKDVLKGEQDGCVVSLATASKTVLYRGEQDDMELTDITKSHIFAMDCEADLQDVGTNRMMDKTVVFSDNQDDLEITKSHTVFIDYQTMEKMQSRPHLKDSKRKSLGQPKMVLAPNDQTVFFSEEGGNDLDLTKSHTTVINSQIIPQGDDHKSIPVDKTIMFTSNNDMELTKPTCSIIDKTVERPKLENAQLLDKRGGSKSMNELCSNKTVVFPAGDENNMEITSVLTKEINHKDILKGEQGSCVLPLATASKTVLYRGEQDDMELTDITKSHNFAMDCEADLQDVGTSKDVDDGTVTKKQRDAIENGNFLQDEQQQSALPFIPVDKTIKFTGDQGVMEMNRSQSTVINEKTLEKLVDQDHVLEMVKKEVCAFDSTILLGKITKSKSKTIPFKFPKHQVKAFTDEGEQRQRSELLRDAVFVDSQPQLLTQSIALPEKEQYIVNEDKLMQSEAKNGNLEVATGNLCTLNYENLSKMLHDDRGLTTPSGKEPKQNVKISEWEATVKIQVNSDSATEIHQLHATHSTLSDPVSSSEAISMANIEPNLNTIKRSENFSQSQISHIANLTEQLPKLGKQVEGSVDESQTTKQTQNTKIGTNNAEDIKDEGQAYSYTGDASYSVPLKTVVKDKIKAKRYSLGIFLPRLPNKRNCSVTGMDALEHNSVDLTDLNTLEAQPVNKKNSDLMSALTEPHLSPSQYINEEHLPLDPEESNSSESISIETKGKALVETYQQEIQPLESTVKEIFNSQKRLLVQGEDDSIPSEKKVRKDETSLSNSAQALQAFDHHSEEYVDKNPCSSLIKSLNRTPSSCSSSSDSIKTDGTFVNYSMQQSSQMESQFLVDHICEENLKEKLHDGRITVREFLSLLQVHILIQKPRQSTLPGNFATNVPSTPKDLMLSQYVYRPKIQIYKEDCQALRQKIEELKLHALKQDKLLVDVNRSLWEVMKGCSDEELKTFGAHLNKMKSRFAKKTKVFAHQRKVVLYSKLVQSAKAEWEKLQTRMDKMDSVLKEADTCLAALDLEIKNMDKNEEDIPMAEWDSEILATEKELEQLQAEEEELKRNISELEIERQQALAQIDNLQQEANRTKKCLEKFNCSEWEIIEWSDSQAVFTFLYDSIELTITFGEPVDGLPFLSKTCRKIIDINFETLLHENKAPPSSLLVHRLIFQFIEDQGSWKNKCITQHHVPKMLQEISLVVSRCRLLGEEIEFLNRWGPKYNLMNIDVNNTEVKLLFSSSAAFSKFELTLTLSAHYPSVPLSFTIQNLIGNIAQDKIAAILSNVPLDNNYLKTAVKCIYQDLLQGPHLRH